MKTINSRVDKVNFNDFEIFIKRDDLLNRDFSGNKARKFCYFLENDFPFITKVVSHGSNQSNAMYSLSVLCQLKGWEFTYYTHHIPSFLRQEPIGNYKYALENKMILIENQELPSAFEKDTLFIPEGGALDKAEFGIAKLAQEIESYAHENQINDLEIFLPSGTGTTALYLQKNLSLKVLTCACVGDDAYLKQQFFELVSDESLHPTILNAGKKYHFGKLYEEFYAMYKHTKEQTHIEFDLLYDSLGFMTLEAYLKENPQKNIMYIHQGGLLGNETMLQRYARKSYYRI